MEPNNVLENIARDVSKCEKCGLHFSRKLAVPGEGPVDSLVMFIGEGPGFYENEQGRPFVGPAGHFLDELLSQTGLKREHVFIGNVVKCRPPGNRDPMPEELAACKPYLEAQIAAINPRVIVTLGRYSMASFIPNGKISAIHGRPVWIGNRLVVPMYHPAAALHQPALRESIVADFLGLPRFLELANSGVNAMSQDASASQSKVATPDVFDLPKRSQGTDESSQEDNTPQQLSLF